MPAIPGARPATGRATWDGQRADAPYTQRGPGIALRAGRSTLVAGTPGAPLTRLLRACWLYE